MILKQLGKASVSDSGRQAGLDGFLELEPNSNIHFLSGVYWALNYFFHERL